MSAIFRSASVSVSQITGTTPAGRSLMQLATPAGNSGILVDSLGVALTKDNVQFGTFLANGNTPFSGSAAPPSALNSDNGIITSLS